MLVRLRLVAKIVCAESVLLRLEFFHRVIHCWLFEATVSPRNVQKGLRSNAASHFRWIKRKLHHHDNSKSRNCILIRRSTHEVLCAELHRKPQDFGKVCRTWNLCSLFFSLTFLEKLFPHQCLVNLYVYMRRNAYIHWCRSPPPPYSAAAPSGPLLPHYRGFMITYTSHSVDSSGRVIDPSQMHLPEDTQRSTQQTDIMPTEEIEPAMPASERPQNLSLRPRC